MYEGGDTITTTILIMRAGHYKTRTITINIRDFIHDWYILQVVRFMSLFYISTVPPVHIFLLDFELGMIFCKIFYSQPIQIVLFKKI